MSTEVQNAVVAWMLLAFIVTVVIWIIVKDLPPTAKELQQHYNNLVEWCRVHKGTAHYDKNNVYSGCTVENR